MKRLTCVLQETVGCSSSTVQENTGFDQTCRQEDRDITCKREIYCSLNAALTLTLGTLQCTEAGGVGRPARSEPGFGVHRRG